MRTHAALVAMLAALCGAGFPSNASAGCGPIQVPADYATIQEAVDVACPGDTIFIASGIYPENVSIVEQSLVMIGAPSRPTVTRIDFMDHGDPIDTLELQRVTITGGMSIDGVNSDVALAEITFDGAMVDGFLVADMDGDTPGFAIQASVLDGATVDVDGSGFGAAHELLGSIVIDSDVRLEFEGGSGVEARNNTFTGGTLALDSELGYMTGNELTGCPVEITSTFLFISVEENTFTDVATALRGITQDLSDITVRNNAFSSCVVGVDLTGGDVAVQDCTFESCDTAITLTLSEPFDRDTARGVGGLVSGNLITGGGDGILVDRAGNPSELPPIRENTVHGCTGTALRISEWEGDGLIERNILSQCGVGLSFDATMSAAHILCNDVTRNGIDWSGAADLEGVAGNFSAGPLFCDQEAGNFYLAANSPCLPGNHPDGTDCGRIGARDVGCGAVGAPASTATGGERVLRVYGAGTRVEIFYRGAAHGAHLGIYDVRGRLVRRFPVERNADRVRWDLRDGDGRDVSDGVYFVRLGAGAGALTGRAVVVR